MVVALFCSGEWQQCCSDAHRLGVFYFAGAIPVLEAAGVGGAGDNEVLASPSPLQVPVWEPEAEQGEETEPESIRLAQESVCALKQRVLVRLGTCAQLQLSWQQWLLFWLCVHPLPHAHQQSCSVTAP